VGLTSSYGFDDGEDRKKSCHAFRIREAKLPINDHNVIPSEAITKLRNDEPCFGNRA